MHKFITYGGLGVKLQHNVSWDLFHFSKENVIFGETKKK
jgi:hypothetical protein